MSWVNTLHPIQPQRRCYNNFHNNSTFSAQNDWIIGTFLIVITDWDSPNTLTWGCSRARGFPQVGASPPGSKWPQLNPRPHPPCDEEDEGLHFSEYCKFRTIKGGAEGGVVGCVPCLRHAGRLSHSCTCCLKAGCWLSNSSKSAARWRDMVS